MWRFVGEPKLGWGIARDSFKIKGFDCIHVMGGGLGLFPFIFFPHCLLTGGPSSLFPYGMKTGRQRRRMNEV
jgi:hypothetical protein